MWGLHMLALACGMFLLCNVYDVSALHFGCIARWPSSSTRHLSGVAFCGLKFLLQFFYLGLSSRVDPYILIVFFPF